MLRTQVDVVLPSGVAVLNAADPRVVEMAELCDGEVVFYARRRAAAALAAHQAAGGKAVLVRQGRVVLASGSRAHRAVPGLDAAGQPGALTHAGVASRPCWPRSPPAWALGMPPDLIGAGLETFEADLQAALASLQLSAERFRPHRWRPPINAPADNTTG